MKKIVIGILSTAITLACSVINVYADSINPAINIEYDESNEIYIVTIPEDEHYNSLDAKITVNTEFNVARVKLNGSEVSSTFSDGAVTFAIGGAGLVYYIDEHEPTQNNRNNGYKAPKTCID